MLCSFVLPQVLLTLQPTSDIPLRLGVPLPARALAKGLRACGGGPPQLQWRRLQQHPDRHTGRVWVELCIAGGRGRVQILAGGGGPADPADGPVVQRRVVRQQAEEYSVHRIELRWLDGTLDWVERRRFHKSGLAGDDEFGSGETWTRVSPKWTRRQLVSLLSVPVRFWRRAGVLPRRAAGRAELRRIQEELVRSSLALTPARGLRHAGDFRRSGSVFTNLEYDTVLGLLRAGLCFSQERLLRLALAAANHQVDMDLHDGTGLLHRHGRDHRSGPPDPGHTWLKGLLLSGLVTADEHLIAAARRLAGGLARVGSGSKKDARQDRCRDLAWPWLGLECWLRYRPSLDITQAADRCVERALARWDKRCRVLRFGEGKADRGRYRERLWLTSGLLLPAMRAALDRTRNRRLRHCVRETEKRLLSVLRTAERGMPCSIWLQGSQVVGRSHASANGSCYLLLEGLRPQHLVRVLRRRCVARALEGTLDPDDPDLATTWSMVARCGWVYR